MPPKRSRTRTRKRDRQPNAVPEDVDVDDNQDAVTIGAVDTTNDARAQTRKRKRGAVEAEPDVEDAVAEIADTKKPSKNTKRKGKRDQNDNADATTEAEVGESSQAAAATPSTASKKNDRFIVFIGNLPFNTTQEALAAHLASVKPSSVRVATHKAGSSTHNLRSKQKPKDPESPESQPQCKGYAFVEFPDASRMKSCLSLFHHSVFNGRKMNVELTAGGGGSKSEARREKVRTKNEKLNEERKRRFEEEQKKKKETEGKKIAEGEDSEKKVEADDGIHPSRRKRVRR
ncbi:hypothetical protein ABW21_db0205527 [Orbilia brochopaga]|nr:hypothetical protein ABW21_db0205527 [Drechslerella brochopaga]